MDELKFGRFDRSSLREKDDAAKIPEISTSGATAAVSPRSYQQCSRCVMDTSDPEITFDDDGRCCHCTEFIEIRSRHRYQGPASDAALDSVVDEIKRAGRGREYDCVVGLSGGVDSSYVAYLAKEKGLRPLGVHMDNGWNSDKAVLNIKRITERLGIDYESFVLDWEEFRDLQLAFLKASVPEVETPTDIAIPAALHRVADRHNVKYILSGGNLTTEGILPRVWHYDARDMKYFKHIYGTFGTRQLRTFPTFGYKTEAYYKLVRGIRMAYPLNLVPYDKDQAMRQLIDKFDWKPYGGKHHESSYTKFIQSYYIYEKFGIDYRRIALSIQVCDGEVTREDAIEHLKRRPYDPDEIAEEKQYISKKLGISTEEFDKIISLPPRWYRDFPNDEKKLGLIYDVYRQLFRKEKLDRF